MIWTVSAVIARVPFFLFPKLHYDRNSPFLPVSLLYGYS
jgi:hypothetical protein